MYYPKPDNSGEGSILAYKDNAFNLVEFTYLSMNKGTTDPDYQRDHVAVMAVIKHKIHGYVLCVTTTHLYYLYERDDVRTYQIAYILNKVLSYYNNIVNGNKE